MIPNVGQAPTKARGLRILLGMERTSHAARRDGSTPKQGKVFLREPYAPQTGFLDLGNTFRGMLLLREVGILRIWRM